MILAITDNYIVKNFGVDTYHIEDYNTLDQCVLQGIDGSIFKCEVDSIDAIAKTPEEKLSRIDTLCMSYL
jgi:hypothetical protein